jgi:citrate lyase beta subunit
MPSLFHLRSASPDQHRDQTLSVITMGDPNLIENLAHAIASGAKSFLVRQCAGRADIEKADAALSVAEARSGILRNTSKIVASIGDSASALLALGPLKGASVRLIGVTWNRASFARDMQCALNSPVVEHARLQIAIAAVAAGVAGYDWAQASATPDEDWRALGFAGVCAAPDD